MFLIKNKTENRSQRIPFFAYGLLKLEWYNRGVITHIYDIVPGVYEFSEKFNLEWVYVRFQLLNSICTPFVTPFVILRPQSNYLQVYSLY